MNAQEKLLISKIEDLFSLCDKYAEPRFSGFLDGAEQVTIADEVLFPYGYGVMFCGGFPDAEKKIMGVFPEWQEPNSDDFPIECIKIAGGFTRKLTHRDYLGTIMSLGLTPQKLGDIIVGDGFAHVFVHRDMKDFIKDNLHKIGNQGVTVEEVPITDAIMVERQYRTFGTVCASPRLDAVVSAATNTSRSVAAGLIGSGKVKLNHRQMESASQPVKEGDLLSVRGYGRFLVHSFDGETRKQRLHITLKQYI